MSKKSNKNAVVVRKLSQSELQKLAYAGTKEAIEKIEKYIKAEKDYEKQSYAKMALEECEFMFYQAKNEKEEDDFMLCELIRRRENYIDDQIMKIEKLKLALEKSALEGKVHEKVLAKHKNKKEEWKYNWSTDFVWFEKKELHEIEESIAYDEAWVAESKKMITTTRYKNMPARYLEHFDFNLDKDFSDDDDCDCSEDIRECDNELKEM